MVSKKYVGDYCLENVLDRHGKLKTVAVYRGPYFRFLAKEPVLKRAKVKLLALTGIASVALLITMLLNPPIMKHIYVALPLALSVLPTVLLWMGLYHLFTVTGPVQRDKSDRIHNRFAGWSLVLLILGAISIVGQIIAYFLDGNSGGIPITGCTAAIVICAIFVFSGRKDLLMEEIPSSD